MAFILRLQKEFQRPWISNITDKKDTATAIGTFTGFQSICTMIASSMAGFLWYNFGAPVTFIVNCNNNYCCYDLHFIISA